MHALLKFLPFYFTFFKIGTRLSLLPDVKVELNVSLCLAPHSHTINTTAAELRFLGQHENDMNYRAS